MTRIQTDRTDVLVVGGGIAGITAALELLDLGRRVTLLDQDHFGGQARPAFGGMLLDGTPEQKHRRIPDSPELALADWQRAAAFDHDERWAEAYVNRCRTKVYDWLHGFGLRNAAMTATATASRATTSSGAAAAA